MRYLLAALVTPLLLFSAGCSKQKIAPVSGRILLNGKPLTNASVTFTPVGGKDNMEPGPSSAGKTDADGRYVLELIGQDGKGAMIGKHKVRIALLSELPTSEDRPDPLGQLPLKYNGQTTLEFEVPAGGSDAANFDLTVP